MSMPRSAFVNVLAWMSLALGACGVLAGALQAVLFAAVWPTDLWLQTVENTPTVPPVIQWLVDHMLAVTLASVLGSALLGLVGWGLLKRREWGRISFIVLLLLGCLMPVASAIVTDMTMGWMGEQMRTEFGQVDPMFKPMQVAMRVIHYGFAAFILAVHGWLVWKLCTPAIRAEFQR